jgi:glycerol kinase
VAVTPPAAVPATGDLPEAGDRGAFGPVLVVDVGTSSVRTAVVDAGGRVSHVHQARLRTSIGPGLIELDALRLADAVRHLAAATVADAGTVAGVGIANQRATTVVWERATGQPVAPAIGWQDLRTVLTCLTLQSEGLRLAPNMSATKVAAILDQVDPDRRRGGELCFGTLDSWVAWTLAGGPDGPNGGLHVTDATNAAVTGMVAPGDGGRWDTWDPKVLEVLRIPVAMLPRIVDTVGLQASCRALPGHPPLAALCGDQQASLAGQGCTRPGTAKATFGTGGMLDLCTGETAPAHAGRGPAGTFPVVAWQQAGRVTWGVEAMMLTAGACVEWLSQDLGIVDSPASSAEVAAACETTGDVWFVPALLGLGTPVWDFGARGTLVGVTRGTGRPEVVRAVLEGVAHRGADLVESAEADAGTTIPALRVDGGMSANPVFVQSLADACGRPVELSPELEATTRGAGMLAGVALGVWGGLAAVAAAYRPRAIVAPRLSESDRQALRARWLDARDRAGRTIPELSGIEF